MQTRHNIPFLLSPPPTIYQFSSIAIPAWPALGVTKSPRISGRDHSICNIWEPRNDEKQERQRHLLCKENEQILILLYWYLRNVVSYDTSANNIFFFQKHIYVRQALASLCITYSADIFYYVKLILVPWFCGLEPIW